MTEIAKALEACEEACAAMHKAMRALEDLLNTDEIVDNKKRMVLAEFADCCLTGSDMAVDAVNVLNRAAEQT